LISGIPTGTSNNNYTFTVTDQILPAPQTVTKTLQLMIGAAPPTLTIIPNALPSGTMLQSYTVTLTASGGTGTHTWDLASGSLPVGLNLSANGVITGTPTTAGTSSPTFRVQDSGNPQQSAQKPLSITIGLPAAPHGNRHRFDAHLQLRVDHRPFFMAQLRVDVSHATFSPKNVALGF
jgi:hypothetical protein